MKKWLTLTMCLLLTMALLAGCGGGANTSPTPAPSASATPSEKPATPEPAPLNTPEAEKTGAKINVAALKGPTGIGMVKLMEDGEKGESLNTYNFTIAAAPDEVVGKVASGEVDVAAVPTNVAATLYAKTEGKVEIMALNTLGVLYVLENGETINSVKDLSGKTLHASGQGATPEYVMNYILEKNGVTDCTIEWHGEHAELATLIASGEVELALLPEPNVTSVLMKSETTRVALDLTEEWNAVAGDESELTMGCLIVRKDFAEENKKALNAFLEEYEASVEYVNSNVADAAQLVEKFGIMPAAAAAEKAIPNCNIVYVDGDEMKTSIEALYNVLFEANPKSIGGALPGEDFYYTK
jgi:NitT/TauT family transport system substrate-binding protein